MCWHLFITTTRRIDDKSSLKMTLSLVEVLRLFYLSALMNSSCLPRPLCVMTNESYSLTISFLIATHDIILAAPSNESETIFTFYHPLQESLLVIEEDMGVAQYSLSGRIDVENWMRISSENWTTRSIEMYGLWQRWHSPIFPLFFCLLNLDF